PQLARLPPVHAPRSGRVRERRRGGRGAGTAAAARPLPADRAGPSPLSRRARAAPAAVAAASRGRGRARRGRHARGVRRRRGHRRPRVRAPVTPAVATRSLSCRYPDATRRALDEVSLELPPATLTVVMGATGAGKSTLVRCLARLVPCFTAAEVTGDIALDGDS